jgi:hypothetical protein
MKLPAKITGITGTDEAGSQLSSVDSYCVFGPIEMHCTAVCHPGLPGV